MKMNITIKFSGEMKMEVDIDDLMECTLLDMIEQYITNNISEVMELATAEE
tara:strand:+ start:392 stop:544 length:153 start_codon:yes stop_codon:yes gene_type:complete